MAFTHISYNQALPHGAQLDSALTALESGYDQLLKILGAMALMIDGDGSQDAHFTEITIRFGFPSDTISRSAWDELNSLKFKLTTNASVTDVNAALLQAWNKFR